MLDEFIARLRADVEDGTFTAGAQVVVRLGEETLVDAAMGDDGLGRPVTPDRRFRVYCTGKPLGALAIASLVERGDLDLDEPLGPRLPAYRSLHGSVTVRQVLNHTAGLHVPDGRTVELTPPSRRTALLEQQERPVGWMVGRQAAYSEHLGWWVLGLLVGQVTGQPMGTYLRQTILEPLGLEHTTVGMTPAEHRSLVSSLGVNLDLRSLKPFPLLFERTERVCVETNPGHGTITTAGDLAALYAAVLRARAGEPVDGLPGAAILATFTSDARPVLYDEVLRRECRYGLGFMTSLADHAFGTRPSRSAFGHSGNVGSSFAFADPERDLSVAVVLNGIVDPDSAFLRRRTLVDALYRDLDRIAGSEPTGDPPVEGAEHPRGRRWRWGRRE